MVRVLFISRSLGPGGAEAQLAELVKHLDKSKFEVTVVTFYPGGRHFERVQSIPSVRLFSMDKKGRWDMFGFFMRLRKLFREVRPQIVCAYSGANEAVFLMGKLFRAKTVLSIRSSFMNPDKYDWLHALLQNMGRYLSHHCSLVISNSQAGKDEYAKVGYCGEKITVIRNGFDIDLYRPDRSLGSALRAEWGVSSDQILIGQIGRIDPMKDHPTFLRAAAIFAKERVDVRFVCIGGRGSDAYRVELETMAKELDLQDRLVWAGVQNDMPTVYNALDINTISSAFGEGVPNALGEAMCCEVPCVTTDVGDAAYLRSDPRWVVPIGDVEGIVARWRILLAMKPEERVEIGKASRVRILSECTPEKLTEQTESAFLNLVADTKG